MHLDLISFTSICTMRQCFHMSVKMCQWQKLENFHNILLLPISTQATSSTKMNNISLSATRSIYFSLFLCHISWFRFLFRFMKRWSNIWEKKSDFIVLCGCTTTHDKTNGGSQKWISFSILRFFKKKRNTTNNNSNNRMEHKKFINKEVEYKVATCYDILL